MDMPVDGGKKILGLSMRWCLCDASVSEEGQQLLWQRRQWARWRIRSHWFAKAAKSVEGLALLGRCNYGRSTGVGDWPGCSHSGRMTHPLQKSMLEHPPTILFSRQ